MTIPAFAFDITPGDIVTLPSTGWAFLVSDVDADGPDVTLSTSGGRAYTFDRTDVLEYRPVTWSNRNR